VTKRKAGPKDLATPTKDAAATSGDVAMVCVGRRYSRMKALGDRYGPVALDPETHHILRPATIKAWALRVLEESGIDTQVRVEHPHQNEGKWLRDRVANTVLKPIELAEDSNGFMRIVAGAGYEHDDLTSLAARAYELAREVELATEDPDPSARAFYASCAYQTAYALGRITMLCRVYWDIDKIQRSDASKKPRIAARDPLRARIVDAMRNQRASGTEFKVVMAAWVRDGVMDGLTIKPVTSGKHKDKYLVTDDSAGQTKGAPYTWATLKKLHTEAG